MGEAHPRGHLSQGHTEPLPCKREDCSFCPHHFPGRPPTPPAKCPVNPASPAQPPAGLSCDTVPYTRVDGGMESVCVCACMCAHALGQQRVEWEGAPLAAISREHSGNAPLSSSSLLSSKSQPVPKILSLIFQDPVGAGPVLWGPMKFS